MPSLSYSRTGSTAQICGNEWGANPGYEEEEDSNLTPRVGREPCKLDHSSPTRYHCAMRRGVVGLTHRRTGYTTTGRLEGARPMTDYVELAFSDGGVT